jgi:hypothetical protein
MKKIHMVKMEKMFINYLKITSSISVYKKNYEILKKVHLFRFKV